VARSAYASASTEAVTTGDGRRRGERLPIVGERVDVGRWRYAIIASDLTKADRHVLLTIAVRMKLDGSGARSTLETLARNVGYKGTSELAVALNRAEELGWVIRERRRGKPTHYFATVPKVSGPPDTPPGVRPTGQQESGPPDKGVRPTGHKQQLGQQDEQQQRGHAQEFDSLVAELPGPALSGTGRSEVEAAWRAYPNGVTELIRSKRIRQADNPAGLLTKCVRDGDHKREANLNGFPAAGLKKWAKGNGRRLGPDAQECVIEENVEKGRISMSEADEIRALLREGLSR
jgi:hypothetical protein